MENYVRTNRSQKIVVRLDDSLDAPWQHSLRESVSALLLNNFFHHRFQTIPLLPDLLPKSENKFIYALTRILIYACKSVHTPLVCSHDQLKGRRSAAAPTAF